MNDLDNRQIILSTPNGECGTLDGVHYVIDRDTFLFEIDMLKEIERLRAELAKPFSIVEPITGPG